MRDRGFWLILDCCHIAMGAFLGFHGKALPFLRVGGGRDGAAVGACVGFVTAICLKHLIQKHHMANQDRRQAEASALASDT